MKREAKPRMNAEEHGLDPTHLRPGWPWARAVRVAAAALLAVAVSGCWMDGPVPEAEEDEEFEIVFGSSESGAGSLLTEYDFGAPVHVHFSAELGGFAVYSGTDPGFVSLEPGEELGSLFPLPDGIPVSVEITDIDAGVQMTLGAAVLAQVGDSAELGETPIHIHPEWQLILAADEEPAPRFISFVLTTAVPGYAASEPYTATIVVEED